MDPFPELLKKIRKEADLTQEDLAAILDVSTVLITLLETGKRQVSRNFIETLAKKLKVHPNSIAPFVFVAKDVDVKKLSSVEKSLLRIGTNLQEFLIKRKANNLKKHA
jgi:transcriptional regulator with XRE-family HTH domain